MNFLCLNPYEKIFDDNTETINSYLFVVLQYGAVSSVW